MLTSEHLPDLTGQRVLVTRPQQQAGAFVRALQASGANAFELPCIEITYLEPAVDEREKAQRSDWWIFTSANAAIGAIRCSLFTTGQSAKIAAIGQATSKALDTGDIVVDLVPDENFGSEQFIETFKPFVTARDRITIVRGDSGRDKLKTSLEALGAVVHYLEVYVRQKPPISLAMAAEIFLAARPSVICITSDLGLTHLLQMLPDTTSEQLLSCPLVVNSERCAELARTSGFLNQIIIARPPGDHGQLRALSQIQ